MKKNAFLKAQNQHTNTLHPFEVMRVINRMLLPGDILISDVGLHKQYCALFCDIEKPQSFFCSNGLGTMGFGLPAALGAKQTDPHRRVITVCGDGGLLQCSAELETSVRYNLPIVCIVFANRSVGLIHYYQKKGFKKANAKVTDFLEIDFVNLARSYGCKGYRVTSERALSAAIKQGFTSDKTVLIEVPLVYSL